MKLRPASGDVLIVEPDPDPEEPQEEETEQDQECISSTWTQIWYVVTAYQGLVIDSATRWRLSSDLLALFNAANGRRGCDIE